MKQLTLSTFFLFILLMSFGQTAKVTVERLFLDDSSQNFDSIFFDFNGTRFFGSDTIPKTIQLNRNLDSCVAVIGTDTLTFFTKFKEGEEYLIRPGCCCAAFTLEALKNPNRGTITFKNTTKKELGMVVCEHNLDTIKAGRTKTTYAHESAMCLFKPCHIQVVETDYFSDKYDYKNDDRSYFLLWIERETFILSQEWFHFLHGEKVEVDIDSNSKKLELKITGYLTENELNERWK
jgi:hypothetical protein